MGHKTPLDTLPCLRYADCCFLQAGIAVRMERFGHEVPRTTSTSLSLPILNPTAL